MKKEERNKTELGVEEIIGKGTYPSVTSNATKFVVAELGGTATSAYSHPVNYNKPPIFSSGGLSLHEAQGQVIEPHTAEEENS